jgi:sugar phosphate isomerase/epimerase
MGISVKLGLDSYSYHYAAGLWEYTPRENAPMTALHFLRKAAELGLDGVHFCDPRHLDSLEYGYVTGLREKAEALGLYLELGTGGTNPDHLQNMVRAAHVVGSPLVRTFLGRPRPRTVEAMKEMLAAAAAEIAQVVPVCERYGVGLAVENHQDLTAAELRQLLELTGSEWVGVCFDTGNPLALLEDPLEALETLAPAVKVVHLKDYQMAATGDGFALVGCALGEGVVDLTRALEVLSAQAPKVSLNVETAVGKRLLPVLDEAYLQYLPQGTAWDLARTLRLVRDRGLAQVPRLPIEWGASEEQILAEEDELALRSVRWAQRALGRPEVELTNSGG